MGFWLPRPVCAGGGEEKAERSSGEDSYGAHLLFILFHGPSMGKDSPLGIFPSHSAVCKKPCFLALLVTLKGKWGQEGQGRLQKSQGCPALEAAMCHLSPKSWKLQRHCHGCCK